MTIAIARKFGRRIVVLSDTQISDTGARADNALPGRLKALVLSPYVSVAYAGHADPALVAIESAKDLLEKTGSVELLIQSLADVAQSNTVNVDFIVAFHRDFQPCLHKITRHGISGSLSECFIGDAEIVARLLRNEEVVRAEVGTKLGDKPEEAIFSFAFTRLFEGVRVNENVGGLPVNLLGSPYGHLYQGGAFQAAWDTIRGGVGITEEQHAAQRSGATAWQWTFVNGPLRGQALLGAALPQAGIGYVYAPFFATDAEIVRIPVVPGSGFIDPRPLQDAILDRLKSLSAALGGGVFELEAPDEQVST